MIAKGLPLLAGTVGIAAPIVAVSGLVPAATPVLLALGALVALALLRVSHHREEGR